MQKQGTFVFRTYTLKDGMKEWALEELLPGPTPSKWPMPITPWLDKGGNHIYQNDIIHIGHWMFGGLIPRRKLYVVRLGYFLPPGCSTPVWGFYLQRATGEILTDIESSTHAVVGNVVTNPEILNEDPAVG